MTNCAAVYINRVTGHQVTKDLLSNLVERCGWSGQELCGCSDSSTF